VTQDKPACGVEYLPVQCFFFFQSAKHHLYDPSTYLAIFHLSSMMKPFISLLLLLQASVASAKVLSLTYDNIYEVTKGKSVFIKFFAPWVSFKLRTGIAFQAPSSRDCHP
jgi:hypothetical protein